MEGVDGDVQENIETENAGGASGDDAAKKSTTESKTIPEEGDIGVIGSATDPGSNESQKNKEVAAAAAEEFEEVELTLPESSLLTQEDLDEIAAEVELFGLDKEGAEKLIASKEAAYKKGLSSHELKMKEQNAAERKELLSMPEFQGENLKSSLESLGTVAKQFGDQEFIDFLKGPAGNSKTLARFMLNIANSMKSDTFVKGSGGASSNQPVDKLRQLYPDFYKDEK